MPKKTRALPKIGRKRCRSQFEFDIYKQARALTPKEIGYETSQLDYTIEHTYVPDFDICTKKGTRFIIEAKGLGRAFDGPARAKMIAVKKRHPDVDIRIVFMSDRPFRKGGKMRPSDWATKYGFPFAIKTIPKEWMDE